MADKWRVVLNGAPVFELLFEGLSWDRATEIRDKMAGHRRRVSMERDEDFAELLDCAEASSPVLRRNRPLASMSNGR